MGDVRRSVEKLVRTPNKYLHQLVIPEDAELTAYPDEFNSHSHVWRSVINTPMPFLASAVGNTAAGTFLAAVRPTLKDPIQSLISGSGFAVRLLAQTQSQTYGLFPGEGDHTISQPNNVMELDISYQNLVCPVVYDSSDEVGSMFHGVSTTGVDFFGVPCSATSATVSVQLSSTLPGGITLLARSLITGAVSAPVTLTQVGTTNQYTGTLTITPDPGMPGVGFQFALGGTAVASSIQPVLNITVAFTNASTALRWDAIQIPGISNALALIDQYRVVAMSALTTYRGSDLDNGGQIAATLFPGGEAPSITDLYTYDQVSQSPCAYDGALKTGAYTFWKPSDH